MTRRVSGLVICFAAVLCPVAESDAKPPNLSKIDRQIKKQPAYTAKEPLYGLYVFGSDAKTHVWAVLDKTAVDAKQYEVLYFDRNANGDLTDEGERITGDVQGQQVTFTIGEFRDPNTSETHTELVLTRRNFQDGSMFLSMKWKGTELMLGGYAEESGPYARFAPALAEAPVFWFDASGRFSFQRWAWQKELKIGEDTDVHVFLGHQGVGPNTFCAVSQNFLGQDVPVLATLIYSDDEGQEHRQASELRGRC